MPAALAILLGVGGGIAAQSFLGGGDADFDLERQVVSGLVPGGDPILAALQRQQLLELGQDPGQLGGQGAPTLRFLQFARSQGPFTADFNTGVFQNATTAVSRIVSEGVAEGLSEQQIRERVQADPAINTQFQGFRENAAVGTGFSSFDDFVNQQIAFEKQRPADAARARELLPVIQAGRDASTRGISEILQDFPLPTQANIDELAGTFGADLRRQRLQQANVGGFPADLRNIDREALLQSLDVFGGQQKLAGGALSALRGDETQRLINALATQERGQAAQLAAAQLAGTQAQAFSQLGTQTELANLQADQEQANQLTNIFGTLTGGVFELGAARARGPATGTTTP
jgi:hypothetical protein